MHARPLAPIPPGAARPGIGERASGHGVSGTIAAVPDVQPLARDGIWRVALAGEAFGRLVRRGDRACDAGWSLLRMDELADEQFDRYEAAMDDAPETADAWPAGPGSRA